MGQFLSKLRMTQVSEAGLFGRATFEIETPLLYRSETLQRTVTVPAGFLTDLASVPRIPIAWTLFGGKANAASVVHDYLYRRTIFTRKQADDVFYEAMIDTGTPAWIAWAMYVGVRLFGGVA